MTSLALDIRWTLLVKMVLLFLLWFVCFKGVKKVEFHPKQWLQGRDSIQHPLEQTQVRSHHSKE